MNRSGTWRRYAALTLTVLMTACSSRAPRTHYVKPESASVTEERGLERKLALQTRLTRLTRLDTVAYPMWTKGNDLCGTHTVFGVWGRFATLSEFDKSPETRQALLALVPVDTQPTLVTVTPGGPAAVAGLQAGDVVTALNGVPVGEGPDGQVKMGRDIDNLAGRPVLVAYRRGNVPMDTVVVPVQSCGYAIRYIEDDAVNASSNGTSVFVTSGLIRFVDNNDELAFVMAHELAHNAEGHIEAKKHNARTGGILDAVIAAGGVNTHGAFARRGALRFSQGFESEADYVGLYVMARAGYDLGAAALFQRRVAADHSSSIQGSYLATHPSLPERFAALEAGGAEIQAKIAAGRPLVPDLKPVKNRPALVQSETAEPEQPAGQQ